MTTKVKVRLSKESRLDFKDISTEQYRTYYYPDGSRFHIDHPLWLAVTASSMGGQAHRILASGERSFYVKPGWIAIEWKAKKESPHFLF